MPAQDTNIENKNFTAKKSLGQNFLHAPNVVRTMVHCAKIEKGKDSQDIVKILEVGPGKGVLTQDLLAEGAHVIAVEKDMRAIEYLQEKFKTEISTGALKLIYEDILTFDPSVHDLTEGNYTIVANIPYYITGEFLRKFLESDQQPKKMVLMLQKEVAKRIATNNQTSGVTKKDKESILSMSVKAYGRPAYITSVPARFFRPIPNVDSAVLCIDAISKAFFNEKDKKISENDFFTLIKAGFAHKRKVLIKNIENISLEKAHMPVSREILEKIWQKETLSLNVRAEELTLETWRNILYEITQQTSLKKEIPVLEK